MHSRAFVLNDGINAVLLFFNRTQYGRDNKRHHVIQFYGVDAVEFIGLVRDNFKDTKKLSLICNWSQNSTLKPLLIQGFIRLTFL